MELQKNQGTKIQTFVNWHPPRIGWYMLNCDGALEGIPGLAGSGGGVIRDLGKFVLTFSANYGHCTSFKAEVLAMTKKIEFARSLQIKHLEIHLDNLACVHLRTEMRPMENVRMI